MPGSKTAYLSKAIIDHVLGKTIYTPPTTMYLAISTAAFDPEVVGTAFSEVDVATSPSYERLAVSNNTTTWADGSLAAPSVKSNLIDLEFVEAAESWGTPLSIYLADASTGGNLLYGADVSSADEIETGGTFKILEGTLIFSED